MPVLSIFYTTLWYRTWHHWYHVLCVFSCMSIIIMYMYTVQIWQVVTWMRPSQNGFSRKLSKVPLYEAFGNIKQWSRIVYYNGHFVPVIQAPMPEKWNVVVGTFASHKTIKYTYDNQCQLVIVPKHPLVPLYLSYFNKRSNPSHSQQSICHMIGPWKLSESVKFAKKYNVLPIVQLN